jgi:5-oxoprolinase (ATP-hydrolysing) subunit A
VNTDTKKLSVDLNCDMGEGFPHDEQLMKFVSSINIACGFHAGDTTVMRKTVDFAVNAGVAIGAHPSFRDLENFGRKEIRISPDEVTDIVFYQILNMKSICEDFGVKLRHVKPHGALYNQAAKDAKIAAAIAEAVKQLDENLILYGLANSYLISEAEKIGLRTASEVFADRTYEADGSLTPRSEANALITDVNLSLAQVLEMVQHQQVTATNGEIVKIKAETICIHGDGENALEFAKEIKRLLTANSIKVLPPSIFAEVV